MKGLLKLVLIGFAGGFVLLVVLIIIGINLENGDSPTTSGSVEKSDGATVPAEILPTNITFEEVNQKFGVQSKLTDLQKDRAWEEYEGKCVEWSGELAHLDEAVFGGFNVGFKHLPHTFTYDVLLDAGQEYEDVFLEMDQGSTYTYKFTLKNYGGAILPISGEIGCR